MSMLAIKGHNTRGKEVIEILEMLGGSNAFNHTCANTSALYYIDEIYKNFIICSVTKKGRDYRIFTLEEFREKFPYKIGDRVRVPEYESEVCISKMYWDGNEVQYEVVTDEVEWYSAEELNKFNEPNKEAPIYLNEKANKQVEEIKKLLEPVKEIIEEIKVDIPKGYEFAGVDDNKQQVVFTKKQSQYLKTYEECCKIMGIEYPVVGGEPGGLSASTYRINEIRPFIYLLICRDAYWKIAGNQMGLGKSWRSSKNDDVYCIFRLEGEIVKDNFVFADSLILEFPTEEMRDAFYENFKDLIEECKKLL